MSDERRAFCNTVFGVSGSNVTTYTYINKGIAVLTEGALITFSNINILLYNMYFTILIYYAITIWRSTLYTITVV